MHKMQFKAIYKQLINSHIVLWSYSTYSLYCSQNQGGEILRKTNKKQVILQPPVG